MTVGLLIDWVSSSYHREVWSGVQKYCQSQGMNLLTLVTGRPGSPFRWEQARNQLLEFLDSRRFDGFLFMTATLGYHLTAQQLRSLLNQVAPAPVVSIGAELEGSAAVVIDHRQGFRELLDHLHHTHGYRRFAYAGGPGHSGDARERRTAFLDFLDDHGLEAEDRWVLDGDFSTAWGHQAVARLIPGEVPEFDVLVCANDEIAIGAVEALARKGLQVPGDVAVTGFDDVPAAALAALTSARQPLAALGYESAALLHRLLQHSGEGAVRLESHTVIRQSCGCLSAAARAAQVEPRSQTPLGFAEWAVGQGEAFVAELAVEGLPTDLAKGLQGSFLRAWHASDSRLFLHGVQQLLTAMVDRSLSPDHLHYPLSVLRRAVLQASEPASRRAFTETTIHQARILLSEVLHTLALQKETRSLLVKDRLSLLNERLLYSRDFQDQAAILLDLFPPLGIGDFRLTLYDDPAHPMADAQLVLTEKGPLPGVHYDPKSLFAPGYAPAEPWSYVAEALFDRNAPLGFFLLDSRGDPALLAIFDQLSERVGRGIETVRRIQALEGEVAQRTAELQTALADLEQRNLTLKDLALRDEMTGLYNRRGFFTLAEHQLKAHARHRHPLTLFFGDLDGLKTINDTRGHEAGDLAIQTTARLLTEAFRAEDVVARLGGDEFVVLAPGCGDEGAHALVQRLSQAFASDPGGYRISLGWVAIDPKANRSLTDWLKEADNRLYIAKERNRS